MFHQRAKFWLCFCVLVSFLSLSLACGGGGDDDVDVADDEGGGTQTGTPYKASGKEGTVTGKIAFSGQAPAPQPIDMNADAVCAQKGAGAVSETVVVKDGKLQNVFVYIKDGTVTEGNKKISGFAFDLPAEPVTLDQNGCFYKPHVMGIRANQKFLVTNSDPTAHNVNVQGNSNPKWNTSQPPNAPPIEQKFVRPETLIPIKCNQHPWMKSYVGVLNHPFFAVSGADGSFTLKGVPPGKYTLVAWHERFGEKTMEVTLAASGTATADFTFDGNVAFDTPHSDNLQVLPAIEFPMLMRH
jgi:hypothetical protein